jgi:hypothetical protein
MHALEVLRSPVRAFHGTLAATADEVRRHLAARRSGREELVARVRSELGPLAEGRIDAEAFAALFGEHPQADPAAIQALARALEVLDALAARGDALSLVEVPAGASLYAAVSGALADVGRAFSTARLAHEVRASRPPVGDPGSPEALPFAAWTKAERRLAPPLVVRLQGGDLRAAALAEFLDGRLRIVLVVEGDCPPAPLARLIAPGTYVLQTHDGSGLDRLAAWEGPGVAALVPESAARFVHDPAAGVAVHERITIGHLPDRAPRKAIGGLSAAQQAEELELLRSLAVRPAGPAPAGAEPAPVGTGGGEPADRLAAWLLSQVDLSDLR